MMHVRFFCLLLFVSVAAYAQPTRWTAQKANAWYAQQPFLVGANYLPANAINQLEMFQADTFDPQTIDKEMAMAQSLGMNTMRVFLHDLLWQQDAAGFANRLDQFLSICQRHRIRPMLVLFDSCWDPQPALGKQRDPQPGIHNSGWLQSPGAAALSDVSQYPRLEAYVKGVVARFKNDKRILAWDVWNEPDNGNDNSYGQNHTIKTELPKERKIAIVTGLLPQCSGGYVRRGPRSRSRRGYGLPGTVTTGATRPSGPRWRRCSLRSRTLSRSTSIQTWNRCRRSSRCCSSRAVR
jgi:hypothetical protein